jgi:hypothetical protein
MMKLMTDMQKRLSDLQKDVNQLKNEKFRPRKFDNTPRFNYGRGQVYGQNYGRGQGYGHNFGRGDGHRQVVVKKIEKTIQSESSEGEFTN